MSFSWLGFRPLYSEIAGGMGILPAPIPQILINSVTFQEGDAVKKLSASTGLDLADATSDKIFGYIVGFITPQGLPVKTVSSNTSYVDGTWTESPSAATYLTSSTNLTVKKIAALTCQAFGLVCSAKESATTGTTTGSDLAGRYIDILTTDNSQLDETTPQTAVANYRLVASNNANPATAKDPIDPTNRVYVVAAETEKGVETAQ